VALLLVATVGVKAAFPTAGFVHGPFMPALLVEVAVTAIVVTDGGIGGDGCCLATTPTIFYHPLLLWSQSQHLMVMTQPFSPQQLITMMALSCVHY
jgi:hypothetical protein